MPKDASFNCELCNFSCSKQSNFNIHCQTNKHKYRVNGNKMEIKEMPKNAVTSYDCVCGKKYNNSSGLWKHKKKCNFQLPDDTESYKDVMLMLIKDNSELKEMILEIVKNGIVNNTNNLATKLCANLP